MDPFHLQSWVLDTHFLDVHGDDLKIMKQVLLVLFTDVRHEDSVPLFHERGIEHRQSRSLLVAWTYEMIQMSCGLMPMCETETELNLVGTETFILMKTTFISLGSGIFYKC